MSVNRYLRNRAGSALQRNDARLACTCVPIHLLVFPTTHACPRNRAELTKRTLLWNNTLPWWKVTARQHLISMGPADGGRYGKREQRERETSWPRPREKGAAPLFGAFHDSLSSVVVRRQFRVAAWECKMKATSRRLNLVGRRQLY